jgi:mRNA-degrading endonuclease RelE of RelBE toxin-antitoxin system
MKAIESEHHSVIRKTIDERLSHGADMPTRNRKRLETPAPFDATWELRFGPDNRFRVLYEINRQKKIVSILAIGIKDRNRLLIGGKEFK